MTWLIRQGIKFILLSLRSPTSATRPPDAQNHYNCPIVTSYAENIKNNVEELAEEHVRLLNPFMAFTDEKILEDRLAEVFTKEENIPEEEVRAAAKKAWEELLACRRDIEKKGEETLKYLEETGRPRHCAGGPPLPCGPRDQPRDPGAHYLLRHRRSDRGLRLPSGPGGAAADRDGPVDVPFPASTGPPTL